MDTDPKNMVFKDHRIRLSNLKKGKNTIKMSITNKYNTNPARDGVGLYKYKDPVDNETYVHTRWVPDYAHYVFPAFD